MSGITTALVAFLLAALALPGLIRSRPHYFIAFGGLIAIILLNALAVIFGSTHHPDSGERIINAVGAFLYFCIASLQIVCLISLLLAVGGLHLRDLKTGAAETLEALRGRSDAVSPIVPITGEQPKPRDDVPPARITLDDPIPPTKMPEPRPPETRDPGIPLV